MILSRADASKSKFGRAGIHPERRFPLVPSFYNAHLNVAPPDSTIDYYVKLADDFYKGIKPRTEKTNKFGIVTCGGGQTYFTNAYIMIRMLRHLGCTLPIELWYLGSREMNQAMKELLKPYGVVCRDAYELRKTVPARILNGWELKPYAIINSEFDEVFFIDADNLPLARPEDIAKDLDYQKTGALFWPDQGILDVSRPIWKVCNVPYRKEPEFETGQMIINKNLSWVPLNLTMHFNEHSDYYYQFMHGDKETFHMAWRRAQYSYGMILEGLKRIDVNLNWVTFCQHDRYGVRVFQHRNNYKWSFANNNPSIPDFREEERCFQFLADLRKTWDGIVSKDEEQPKALLDFEKQLSGKTLPIEYKAHNSKIHFGAMHKLASDEYGFVSQWVTEDDGISLCLRLMDTWKRTIAVFRPENGKLVARDYRNEIRSTIFP